MTTYAHDSKVEGIRFQGAPACTNMVDRTFPSGHVYNVNCGEPGSVQSDGSVRCPTCLRNNTKWRKR